MKDKPSTAERFAEIDLIDTQEEGRSYFMNNNNLDVFSKLHLLEKLVKFRDFEFSSKIFTQSFTSEILDQKALDIFTSRISKIIEILEDKVFVEILINFLIDFIKAIQKPYERFIVCKLVSSLVLKNKEFPSKMAAVFYFQTISLFFRRSSCFIGLLNAAKILADLEIFILQKDELQFLKQICNFRNEKFPKDLFCGIKRLDYEDINIETDNGDFDWSVNYDSRWLFLLENMKNNEIIFECTSPEMKQNMITFCLINRLTFEFNNTEMRIAFGTTSEGFTTLVFNIIKRYETRVEMIENIKTVNNEVIRKPKDIKKIPNNLKDDKPPAVLFKDRFTKSYRKLKTINKNTAIRFDDQFYEDRKAARILEFDVKNKIFEEKKAILVLKADVIERLHLCLADVIEKKNEAARIKAEELRKIEKEKMEAERQANKWSNQHNKINVDVSGNLQNMENLIISQQPTEEGVYRPPKVNIDLLMKNTQNLKITKTPEVSTTRNSKWNADKKEETKPIYVSKPSSESISKGWIKKNADNKK